MADQMKFRVTPEQVDAARAKLAEAGFPIPGESGAIEKDGYRIGYSLVGGVLQLEVLAKPRFIPMITVKARIRSMLIKEGNRRIGVSGRLPHTHPAYVHRPADPCIHFHLVHLPGVAKTHRACIV